MITTDLPHYMYDSNELPEGGDGALFHYTSAENFFKILEDMTLKTSSFKRLNDLNEGNVHNLDMNKNFMLMYDAEKYIQECCSIISFSQNYSYKGYVQKGTNHPGMWAHYANNSDGVCIVIDKEAFIERNKDIFDKHFYCFDDVEYSFFNAPDGDAIKTDMRTVEEFILQNCKNLFFLKHMDWECEGEHRLFMSGYTGKFTIIGCIKFVALGEKFWKNNERIKRLVDMLITPQYQCYRQFVPHSFAMVNYNRTGYFTHDCAFKIVSCLQFHAKEPNPYKDCLEWLNKDQGYSLG